MKKFITSAILISTFILLLINQAVVQAKSEIKLNKNSVKMSTADSVTLKVFNTDKKVVWSSSNKEVARVDNKGKVTPIWFGKAIISAKVGNKTLNCTINVLQEEGWDSTYKQDYSISIMPTSKNKVRIKLFVSNKQKNYFSGNLYGKYEKDGSITFTDQGKYKISGSLKYSNNKSLCTLIVTKSMSDIFLTDSLTFDIKVENS